MQAIATCEFLLSPALCESNVVDDFFLSLTQLHSDILHSSAPPLIEEDAYYKLVASDRFPTDKVFSQNIKENGVSVFTAQDITTLVNKILVDAKSLSDLDQYWVQEWQNLLIIPPIGAVSEQRREELLEFFSTLAIYSLSSDKATCALHFEIEASNETSLQGELVDAFPLDVVYPLNVSKVINVFPVYKNFLCVIGHEFFLSDVKSEYDFKLAIFAGALKMMSQSNHSTDQFELDSFFIGRDFIDSLKRNQSYVSCTYFNVVFDTVINLLAGTPKNEVSPFRVGVNSTVQRLSSDKSMKAFRTHITSSGLALRLMYWQRNDGKILLANVGPKNECEISE